MLLMTESMAQTDSLILYDPVALTQQEIIIQYDPNQSIESTRSSIGALGNKVNLNLTLPDSIQNEFTSSVIVSNEFDLLSYPVRTNIAILHSGKTNDVSARGSGVLISPNAVLTSGHLVGYEINHNELGKIFRWRGSIAVSPSHQDGNPQKRIGAIKVKKCYVFKRFVNDLGRNFKDDIALLILDEPIGYKIGWLGLGYVASDTFLINNVFYNFSYPGTDGYDGLNMFYKYGKFSSVSSDFSGAFAKGSAVQGESGSGFFNTDNFDYTVFGVRTYQSAYTLVSEDKFRVLEKLIYENLVLSIGEQDKELKAVAIYPNPASKFVTIRFDDQSLSEFDVSIISIHGNEIFTQKGFKNGSYINVNNFSSGIYIVGIKSNKLKITRKMIIK